MEWGEKAVRCARADAGQACPDSRAEHQAVAPGPHMTIAPIRRATVLLIALSALVTTAAAESGKEDEDFARKLSAAQVPVERFPEPVRSKVAELLQPSSVFGRGPVEVFPCRPFVYAWLLDNPHAGVRAWQSLKATKVTLERQADGSFVGRDGQGGELRWQTILAEPGRRIWLIEGAGRLLPLTPPVAMRALLILRYQEVKGTDGRVGVRHRCEVFAQSDAKTLAALGKLFGMPPETAARKTLEQVELFFSGMAWYLTEHPGWAQTALRPPAGAPPEESRQVEVVLRELAAPAAKPPAAVGGR
jgi:hypothetical protein